MSVHQLPCVSVQPAIDDNPLFSEKAARGVGDGGLGRLSFANESESTPYLPYPERSSEQKSFLMSDMARRNLGCSPGMALAPIIVILITVPNHVDVDIHDRSMTWKPRLLLIFLFARTTGRSHVPSCDMERGI